MGSATLIEKKQRRYIQMRLNFNALILLTVIAKGRAKCVTSCTEGWESHGNHCFKWKTHYETWDSAQICCKSENANLASVTSEAINQYVLEGMRTRNLSYIWIGGNDKDEEGTWKWVDGVLLNSHSGVLENQTISEVMKTVWYMGGHLGGTQMDGA